VRSGPSPGFYQYKTCGSHEPATEADLPPPPDTTKAYFATIYYRYGTGCTGPATTVAYQVEGACVYSGSGYYTKLELDPSGTSATQYYCRSETRDCPRTTITFDGSCVGNDHVFGLYPPRPPAPTVFSTPYDLAIGTEREVGAPVNGGTPEYVYCTGRGAVEGTMCRMNGCGDTTGHFVAFGAGPSTATCATTPASALS